MLQKYLHRYAPLLAHNRNFRWVWASTVFTSFEEMLGFTAINLYVLNLTGSGAALAAMWAVQALPAMLTGPLAGILADRFNRKRLWLVAASVVVCGFALYSMTQSIEQLFPLIALNSIAITTARNAYLAMLPDLVEDKQVIDANALTAMNFNLALTLAPLVAGVLVAASGAHIAFFLLAALRLSALLCMSRLQYRRSAHPAQHKQTAGHWLDDLKAGFRYARDHATVRAVLLTAAGASFATGGLLVLEALLVKQVLNAGDTGYGLMLSLAGFGAFTGSLLIKPSTRRWSILRVFAAAATLTGLTFFPYASILWFPATLAIAYAQTITFAMVMILTDTLIQSEVGGAMRGRVFGLLLVIRHGMTLAAMAVFGPLVDTLGVLILLHASGVIYTLTGLYAVGALWQTPAPPKREMISEAAIGE